MPVGLMKDFRPTDFADLLAYLKSLTNATAAATTVPMATSAK